MRVTRKYLIVCALMAGVSLWSAPAQSQPGSLTPLAKRFVAAAELERVEMAASTPEVKGDAFWKALNQAGVEADRRRDFGAAEQFHMAVLWLGNHFNDDAIRTVAFVNLTRIHGQRGDFAAAQPFAANALRLAEQINDLSSVQSALANLGIIQRRLGDAEGALQSFERSLVLAEQLKNAVNAARVVNNMGLAYADLGNMAKAREFLDRSLVMKTKLGDSPEVIQDIARTLNNIGTLYDQLGDFAQALDHVRRALALIEQHGAPSPTLLVANIGHLLLKMGQYEQAREPLTRAMALAEQRGEKQQIATSMYLLGQLERYMARYADAEVWQRRSLALREEIGEPIPMIDSLNELSGLAMALKRPADAHELASRSVAIASAARLPGRLTGAQTAAAEALAELKRPDEAIAMYQPAIDGIEELRQQTLGGDRGRQQYLSGRSGPHYGLARLHAVSGRPFEALLAVERARSRTLLDVMSGGRQGTRWLSGDQRRRERELTQAVISASAEIEALVAQPKYDAARLPPLEEKLTRARLARDAFTSDLYKSTPDLRIARGDAAMISRDDLNALVKPATAIVSLVLNNNTTWAYVITRTSAGVTVAVREIGATAAELTALADDFAGKVASRDLGFAASGRKLYDLLFVATKIEPLLNGKSRLVIVPDGPLWRVPFQALRTPRDTYLIEERAVAYAPSVAALAALERRRESRPAREPYLMALGDPAIASPSETPGTGTRKARARLPHAAREVAEIGRLYGASNSRILVGERATEQALRTDLNRATVVHLATHGILDDVSPMYSHLMLTPLAEQSSDSDGRLEAWELIDTPLNVDLAVLSACETARGPVGDGEGVIGLTWSLFAAGASTAVVSQWEVDSASTSALMIAFHERLLLSRKGGRERGDTPEAMRVAAMRLMRDASYRHPFYWAGFVVIGAS